MSLRKLPFAVPLLLGALCAGCPYQDRSGPGLYASYCARCHGDQGEGKGDADSMTLYPHLNLHTSPMLLRGDRPEIRRRISEGQGPMPGFQRRLDAPEMERLIDFTLKLARDPKERPSHGPATPEGRLPEAAEPR